MKLALPILLATLLALAGCSGDEPGPRGATPSKQEDARSGPPPEIESAVTGAAYVPAPEGTLTFTKDVAPIVHARCARCHRPGEAAPFPLLTYEDVRKRATQVVSVIRSGFMPPWLPEPGYNDFVGDRSLPGDELGKLVQWVREGALEGDPADLPPLPTFPEGWQLGEPNVVVELPQAYTLAAGGPDVFRNFVIPRPVGEDGFVRGMEFRPRNAKIVHHAEFRIDRSSASRRLDAEDPEPGFAGMDAEGAQMPDGHFLGWVPGKTASLHPDGMSWRLGPDTDFVVQFHLLPSGKPERLQPQIGLFLTDEPPRHVPVVLRLGSRTMDIPAEESEYVISDAYTLPVDVELLSVFPHAHYLGKDMQAWAVLPDGSRRWLIRIKDWDFNWQDDFRYVEPIALPRGTRIVMRYTFDNSSENPRNPHFPPRRVLFGPSTYDEMADLWLQVLPGSDEDRGVLQQDFGRFDAARTIARYETYLAREPDDAETRNNLGHQYLVAGRPEDALAQFEEAVRLDPDYAHARRNLAVAVYRAGDVERALIEFRRALQLEPDDPEAHFTLGQVYWEQRQAEPAIGAYRKAVELRPDYPEAHFFLGTALERTGRRDEALVHLGETLRIEPDWVVPLRTVAWWIATHPDESARDVGRALRLAERAVELTRGRDPLALEALAAAQAQGGDAALAIGSAERALALVAGSGPERLVARLRANLERYRQGLGPATPES